MAHGNSAAPPQHQGAQAAASGRHTAAGRREPRKQRAFYRRLARGKHLPITEVAGGCPSTTAQGAAGHFLADADDMMARVGTRVDDANIPRCRLYFHDAFGQGPLRAAL